MPNCIMFSEIFYTFFWKINVFARTRKGIGPQIPFLVKWYHLRYWLFIWVPSHKVTLLSILDQEMLLLAYSPPSQQEGTGGKNLCSVFCYDPSSSMIWHLQYGIPPEWKGMTTSSPPEDRIQLSDWISCSWIAFWNLHSYQTWKIFLSWWPWLGIWWVSKP